MKIVLVAEDNEAVQRLLTRSIMRAGFHVITVESGDRAWNSVRVLCPFALITDIQLKGMSGLELLRRCRSHDELRTIKVAVISGDVTNIPEAGIDADVVFEKPFDMHQIVNWLEGFNGGNK